MMFWRKNEPVVEQVAKPEPEPIPYVCRTCGSRKILVAQRPWMWHDIRAIYPREDGQLVGSYSTHAFYEGTKGQPELYGCRNCNTQSQTLEGLVKRDSDLAEVMSLDGAA